MDNSVTKSWHNLTTIEQMINIGNEVKRAFRSESDPDAKNMFIEKAIKYINYSIDDPKNKKLIPELEICSTVLSDYSGDHNLDVTKDQINNYFYNYQLLL